jgi:dienelactone hydrolase
MYILFELKNDFPYDENKVFIVGYGGGAQFAERFTFKHPTIVHASCLIYPKGFDDPPDLRRHRKVKFFIGASEGDPELLRDTQKFYKRLLGKGYSVEYKVYPGKGFPLTEDLKQDVIIFIKNVATNLVSPAKPAR